MSYLKLSSNIVRVIIGAVILQIIAFYNTYPLVYSDTGTYIYSGFDLFVPKDRPILYGILVRLFSFKQSLWLVVFIQNLITSFLIFETIRLFIKEKQTSFFYLAIGVLVLGTSVGWYSNQIMPDFFAPILILSWVWILFQKKSSTLKKVLIWIIFIVANCTHFSHLFLSTVLLLLVLIIQTPLIRKRFFLKLEFQKKKLFTFIFLVFFSWLLLPTLNTYFGGGFKLSRGGHVFLVAHLNEKEILKQILDKHCDSGKLEGCSLCEEKDDLPKDINGFIWSGDFLERQGGWDGSKEQFDKIISISLKEPKFLISNIYYSAIYGFLQLPQIETGEGLTSYGEHSAPFGQVGWRFPHELNSYLNSKQNKYNGKNLNFETINIFHISLVLISLLFLFFITIKSISFKIPKQQMLMVYFVIISIALNSFVTAGLSAPYSRYQSRVIWLVPFIALILFWAHRKNFFPSKKRS
jgi:hypothetical protein